MARAVWSSTVLLVLAEKQVVVGAMNGAVSGLRFDMGGLTAGRVVVDVASLPSEFEQIEK